MMNLLTISQIHLFTKEQISFKNENRKASFAKCKSIAMRNADNKEIQVEDRITPYPHGSNISFMKFFDKEYLILLKN